jgi:hypothetical protein
VPTKSQPYDPGQCIRSNHGDWNACNVGSSGQGARSDRTVSRSSKPYTPDQCILNNHGDWNACNVGNSGSGDRPYRQVRV